MGKNKQQIIFLEGQKVILRPLRKETDLESCLRWINDPEVRQYLKNHLPFTVQQESDWFDQLSQRTGDIILAIETLEGAFIGTMGLHRIDWQDRVATTGALIGEKDYWGQGYGTDAKMVLLDYAFNTLNLRKICSSTFSYNKRSLQYLLHCGYQIEGRRRRQRFRGGKYWDEIILGLFKHEWAPIWKRYQETGKVR